MRSVGWGVGAYCRILCVSVKNVLRSNDEIQSRVGCARVYVVLTCEQDLVVVAEIYIKYVIVLVKQVHSNTTPKYGPQATTLQTQLRSLRKIS